MNLKDKSYKELCDLQLDITNELSERFRKDSLGNADEFVAIKDIEIATGALRTALERQGKVVPGEPK